MIQAHAVKHLPSGRYLPLRSMVKPNTAADLSIFPRIFRSPEDAARALSYYVKGVMRRVTIDDDELLLAQSGTQRNADDFKVITMCITEG